MPLLLLAAGLVLLIAGAEMLVRGASRIAAVFGVPPLVIGLTIVAMGTSAPEMAVSAVAAAGDRGDLAIGNVLGSNILNVLLILGLSAVIAPLNVARQLVRLDVPVVVALSIGVWALASNGTVGAAEGVLLIVGLVAYTAFLVRKGRADAAASLQPPGDTSAPAGRPTWQVGLLNGALITAGLGLLVVGSDLMVDGATEIALRLGVNELTIGLTVVALGTSLPELATSVLATIRGERDLAVGNVVGSNLFNLTGVLGVAAVAAPGGLPIGEEVLRFDFPIVIASAVACLPIFFTGHRIDRWEGALFLAYYVAYTAYVVAAAIGNSPIDELVTGMLWFVVPLTVLTLGVLGFREMRRPDFGPDA
jgi:cation:H+ antiporter